MRMCQHCGAGIPNYAGFCGECGQLVSIDQPATQERTAWMSHSAISDKEQTTIITEDRSPETTGYHIEDEMTSEHLAVDNAAEEEKRRRNALIGFSLPLLGTAIEGPSPNVPMIQGTPQISGAPTVAGTPSIGHGMGYEMGHGMHPMGTQPLAHGMPPLGGTAATPPLILPSPGGLAYQPPPLPNTGPPPFPSGNPPGKQPSGCMVLFIAVIIVPLIILASITTVAFTFLAPTLVLNGNASVATGGVLQLHGGHFLPGNSVTFVLDGSIVLSHASLSQPTGGTHTMAGALILAQQSAATTLAQTQQASAGTTVIVGSDGTFSVAFIVGQDWKAGQHTIRATEAFSPRSATTTFTVIGNGQPVATATSTPGATATATAIKTATGTPTPTTTPSTTGKAGLSAITPNMLSFGPFSEGYAQTTSTQVLLNTNGTGALKWTTSWDTVQAPWLKLSAQSGQVQAPGSQTLIVSAVVGALKAGTYNATILFSSDAQNGQQLSLPVSLTVQAGCMKATPTTLLFASIIGAKSPVAQTVTLNNCGASGNWTATTTGGSWLLVSPTGGNLSNGATQNILISALLANIQSGPGTYQGQITFTNGPAHAIVNVTFTVTAPLPKLGINITNFSISQQCTFVRIMWRCPFITLSSNGTGNLTWTATSKSNVQLTITPASGVLPAGQTTPVEIDTPRLACASAATIATVTFSGPANNVTVTMRC